MSVVVVVGVNMNAMSSALSSLSIPSQLPVTELRLSSPKRVRCIRGIVQPGGLPPHDWR